MKQRVLQCVTLAVGLALGGMAQADMNAKDMAVSLARAGIVDLAYGPYKSVIADEGRFGKWPASARACLRETDPEVFLPALSLVLAERLSTQEMQGATAFMQSPAGVKLRSFGLAYQKVDFSAAGFTEDEGVQLEQFFRSPVGQKLFGDSEAVVPYLLQAVSDTMQGITARCYASVETQSHSDQVLATEVATELARDLFVDAFIAAFKVAAGDGTGPYDLPAEIRACLLSTKPESMMPVMANVLAGGLSDQELETASALMKTPLGAKLRVQNVALLYSRFHRSGGPDMPQFSRDEQEQLTAFGTTSAGQKLLIPSSPVIRALNSASVGMTLAAKQRCSAR